jgi:hypothetical protein|nr:MAG TPA: hypothetical protein [Crassvirales sp.]
MKTYTFEINKNNKKNTFPKFFTTKSTNYSKILDNIIATNIINTNQYLKDATTTAALKEIGIAPADDSYYFNTSFDKFMEAAKFLASYKYKSNMPYILNKKYYTIDGTPIIFYNDEIQIGTDIYEYSDFGNIDFINGLTPKKKKIIINIATPKNTNININITK